jgi:hypothetical protein
VAIRDRKMAASCTHGGPGASLSIMAVQATIWDRGATSEVVWSLVTA